MNHKIEILIPTREAPDARIIFSGLFGHYIESKGFDQVDIAHLSAYTDSDGLLFYAEDVRTLASRAALAAGLSSVSVVIDGKFERVKK